ncbi:phytoene desaturase family protein [Saccharopolyspora phatthalungensis]|uniref:Pyridine nucleotide-disulfide oxidoreductase domain-containing protein 2 n=1 Tax=Saccharopolyspora phatthalungensis TaxID=664693 RepID=A0A840QJW5_9PSEU|nr:NAD(P)/FAD-dependent oxidoreductase [Saccharopolyspora phatthalungensis]MBB5159395.1 phytoene dehydrogenase-like protein [Saccharopolyspora phatthalungensis]
MRSYDAIVIGTGHSGLVAAFYLARAGWSVLMLERRDLVGGTCVTEEIFAGYRGSSVANASHSLDPRILRDMDLTRFGLRFRRPELGSLTMFADGRALAPWPDRAKRRSEIAKFARSERDLDGFYGVLAFFRAVAQRMDVSFYDPPPSLPEVAARFRTPAQQRAFEQVMFGSVADILEEHLDSPELQAFFAGTAVATNLVGPRTPGSAYLLLQRPLWEESLRRAGSHEENDLMMRNAAPLGGIGAITGAMAEACRALGVEIRTGAEVARIVCERGRAAGVALADGTEFRARRVLSNASPKLTLTRLLGPADLGDDLYRQAEAIPMKGSSAKVHLALDGTARFAAATSDEENLLFLGTNFRVAPSIEVLQQAYHEAVAGRWPERPTITGMIDSAHDPSLTPPGCHFVSISVRGVPYHLAHGTWDEQKDDLGKAVIATLEDHIPNLSQVLADYHVYSPADLEREFALPEGNGAHGDIVPGRIFDARPMPGCAGQRTPVPGLYLCGVGTWPGNFMSGVTGYNAATQMLADARSPDPAA